MSIVRVSWLASSGGGLTYPSRADKFTFPLDLCGVVIAQSLAWYRSIDKIETMLNIQKKQNYCVGMWTIDTNKICLLDE
jgi:hypothetical protein